jgi:hypothetical protein
VVAGKFDELINGRGFRCLAHRERFFAGIRHNDFLALVGYR